MSSRITDGFTIIEVMLFLAVTGVLSVGILVGSGIAIGQQRYRDSVSSTKSFFQEQYSFTSNVVNGRDGSEACKNGNVITPPSHVPQAVPRGTADCLMMGRFVTIDSSGTQLTAANVIGYRTSQTAPIEATDEEELTKNYTLTTSPIDKEAEDVEWSAHIVKPKTTTPQPLSLLIIRSPVSGSIMTFASNQVQTDLNSLASSGSGYKTINLCVVAETGSFVGQPLAIRINPLATSASAIEVPAESEGICG